MLDELTATQVGQAIQPLLERGGFVHSVFRNAVNLVALADEQEYLLPLMSSGVHEYGLTCPHLPVFSTRFQAGQPFCLTPQGLHFPSSSLTVITAKASIWRQPVFIPVNDKKHLRAQLDHIKLALETYRPGDSFGTVSRLNHMVESWDGGGTFPPPDWLERLQPFVGLGPGLTPLGDDYLSGYLTATFWLCNDASVKAMLTAGADLLAGGDTTVFSQTQIRMAGRGVCLGSIFTLIQTLNTPVFDPELLSAVLAIGSSSGYGWLAGIAAAGEQFFRIPA